VLVSLLLSAIASPVCLPAQDLSSQQQQRLAEDQARLAPQLRRLSKLFELLEKKAVENGDQGRINLLSSAREKLLNNKLNGLDVVEQIERIAIDLTEQRTGPALEAQQELVLLLEDMLNDLLERELQERLESALEQALTQAAEIKQTELQQRELLNKNQTLQEQAQQQTSEATDVELTSELEQLLAQQLELNQVIKELLAKAPTQSEIKDALEAAQRSAEAAEAELNKAQQAESDNKSEEMQKHLDAAEDAQKEAAEQLEKAGKEAGESAEKMQQQQKEEALLNLMKEAEGLLERHLQSRLLMEQFINTHGEGRVPRSARIELRSIGKEQAALSSDAQLVLDEVNTGGADTLPYLMQTIINDHQRLSSKLGPPSYRCRELQLSLADDISSAWLEIIESIRVEAEREREKIEAESASSGGGNSKSPLVSFSEELQLLKRLQERLTKRLDNFATRRQHFSDAGMELDQDDLLELERLLQKQAELRQVYESILARLEEAQQPEPENPEAPADEEEFF